MHFFALYLLNFRHEFNWKIKTTKVFASKLKLTLFETHSHHIHLHRQPLTHYHLNLDKPTFPLWYSIAVCISWTVNFSRTYTMSTRLRWKIPIGINWAWKYGHKWRLRPPPSPLLRIWLILRQLILPPPLRQCVPYKSHVLARWKLYNTMSEIQLTKPVQSMRSSDTCLMGSTLSI